MVNDGETLGVNPGSWKSYGSSFSSGDLYPEWS